MSGINWISYIKKYADEAPDRIAFRNAGGESLTYGDLYDKAMKTAGLLLENFGGKMPEAPVAVTVERDMQAVPAIFGVIAAGGWYVPVDCSLPSERADVLLEICNPAAVLLGTETNPFTAADIKVLKADYTEKVVDIVPSDRDDKAPLFGIFTSGSTGLPKLVVKDNLGISDFIKAYCSVFGFTENEHFGNQVPFYFDASTKDIFSAVYLGASVSILPQKVFSFPMDLVKTLDSEQISALVCVPSVMGTVARYEVFNEIKPQYLKNVLFVGERMPVKYLNYWKKSLPGVRFVNLYGSTEVAGNSCYYIVERNFTDTEIIPVGIPFETSAVVLLDENGNQAPEGEICVSGTGLAIGYYNDREKTDSVFRYDEKLGVRLYHSGDFGRLDEQGRIVCISRKDSQIKHMGHRIELGEIEACACGFEYVKECCCLFSAADDKLTIFFSASAEFEKQLKRDLRKKLPKYMIPDAFVLMDELPHNRNGKIDRALLKKTQSGI